MQPILSKDSANFAEYTICEDKNRKSIPYLTFFIFIPEIPTKSTIFLNHRD